jgi:hypothetical protein
MVTTFLDQSWKKFARSVSFSKDLATTLFLGFLALMISGYLLVFGFVLPHIITETFGQSDPVGFLHRFLLYYFLFEFILRYLLQNVPVLEIQPYLHLPIKRSSIIHFLLGKSVFHVLNCFILLILTPFAFTVVAQQFGQVTGISWIAGLWLISITIHYLVILYKVKLDDTFWGIVLLLGVFTALGVADFYGWFRLTEVSGQLFGVALTGPFFVLGSLFVTGLIYVTNYRVFWQSIYTDEFVRDTSPGFAHGKDFGFLKSLGLTGDWINLELKLILRNKRPRTILFLSVFFLSYGLVFYPNPRYTTDMAGFLLFVGIFVTGVFMINYGQYLFSWQANHFDFTLTRPVSIQQYLNSKYLMLAGITFLCFLLTIPYVYFGWKILLINGVMMLFNIGVNTFVLMNLAMWGPKKIDLTKGGAFNIQGVGAAQWVMGIPVFLGPYLFYLPFSLAGYPFAGIIAVGLAGLTGIIFKPYLISLTANRLENNKHRIAEGFRKN